MPIWLYCYSVSDDVHLLRVEKVVPIQEIGAFLSQHLPGEVNDFCGIGVSKVEDVDGDAAFVNVDGKRTLNYEFRITLEVVHEGSGYMVQLANITNDGSHPQVQQNETSLSEQQAQAIVTSIRRVLENFRADSLE